MASLNIRKHAHYQSEDKRRGGSLACKRTGKNHQHAHDLKRKSFHLNINISDSTNLNIDKSKYIEAVHKALTDHLTNIHPVSYTVIHEVKADAYGYDGLTKEYKYIHNL